MTLDSAASSGAIQLLAASALDSRPAAETLIGFHTIGIDTVVLSYPGARYAELLRTNGIALQELPAPGGVGYRVAAAIRMRLAMPPADILYLDSIRQPCASVLLTAALNARTIVRLSYLECQSHPSLAARFLYKTSRVDRVLCDVWPERAHDVLTARWLSDKIKVLPTCHDTSWYASDVDLGAVGIPAGAFTIASVSEQKADAGLRWLIACAQWIPMDLPIHFLLIAPESEHDRLRRSIRKMPFTQRFHLSARLREAPALLAASSVAVVTAWASELQRRACMQSLSAGVPVLAADGPLVAEVVQPEVNGELISQADPERLAQSIFELYENKSRHKTLSAGARRIARQWPSMQQRLLELRAEFERGLASRAG